MKKACACLLAVVAVVAAAPKPLTEGDLPQETTGQQQGHIRDKRSYGGPYVSPCGAASAPIPAYAPVAYPQYAPSVPAHHAPLAPPPYGYGVPHYRADMGEEHEMMGFSDMEPLMSEHMPSARYSYAAPAYGPGVGLSSIGGPLVAPASTGPAFGVFPNANVGGCSVPLLLSCSPSVVPGRIVKSQSQYPSPAVVVPAGALAGPGAGLAAGVYREVDDHHTQAMEHNMQNENMGHDHMTSSHEVSHQ